MGVRRLSGRESFKSKSSLKEIPVIAYDVTNNKRTPVAGMQVTLTSIVNNASLTVTTDEAGCAVADIGSLVDPDTDAGEGAETYAGYVSVEATCPGYRTHIEPSSYVQSGVPEGEDGEMPNALQVPTQPNDIDVNIILSSCTTFSVRPYYRTQSAYATVLCPISA